MKQITIEVNQEQDLALLLLLVQKLGFKVVQPNVSVKSTQKRLNNLAIVEKGTDVTAINDPVQWQREQRKDRDLLR